MAQIVLPVKRRLLNSYVLTWNIYSASCPPSLPALRDSVWMKRLMRKRHGRKVPRRIARYAPNWTSREREVDGITSTIESIAKTGVAIAAGIAPIAAFFKLMSLTTTKGNKKWSSWVSKTSFQKCKYHADSERFVRENEMKPRPNEA